MICSIVVLYEPGQDELKHIYSYCDLVDIIFILDNSEKCREEHILKVVDELKDNGKRYVIYKHFSENIGLCKALNYGMKRAQELECEWALIMDSDSLFITDIVYEYKKYLESKELRNIAVLSPVHIHDRSRKKGYNGYKELKWAMTSGCFYNINIFNSLSGFKEELFVDGLDIDYCYKAINNNYKIVEIGTAQIQHYPGETKEVRIKGKTIFKYGYASSQRYFMQSRALIWIVLRYHKFEDVLRLINKWIKVICLFDNKTEYVKEMRKGTVEGFKLWKKTKTQ